MRKYLLSSVILLALVGCNLPPSGNKDVIPLAENQPRYSDNFEPASVEPNFATVPTAHKNLSDSVQVVNKTVTEQPSEDVSQKNNAESSKK